MRTCEDPRFHPRLSSWEDSSQNTLVIKTPPKTRVSPQKGLFFNRKYIWTNHFFFRGEIREFSGMYVVSSGALKVEIDTLPETNSKFTPENIWLEDKILVLLVIRAYFSVAYSAVRFFGSVWPSKFKDAGCRQNFVNQKTCDHFWIDLDPKSLESFGGGSP